MSEVRFNADDYEQDQLQDALDAAAEITKTLKEFAARRKGNVSRIALCRAIVRAMEDVDFKDTTRDGREHPYSLIWNILTECEVGHPVDDKRPAWLEKDYKENVRTFEEFLRDEIASGKIDFSLRATDQGTHVSFYIHATGKDSSTVGFFVLGNGLSTKLDTNVVTREGMQK